MTQKILILIVIVLAIACSPKFIEPTQADADRTNTTVADLKEGMTLYKSTCAQCHNLHLPNEKNADEWKTIVPKMAEKAKIDDATEKKILNYLVTMCTAK